MATEKKSFILYCDLLQSIEHLTDEEKGKLFTHLLEYVNDRNPVLEDRLLLTAWKPIELSLKRDLKKFKQVKIERSKAGKRSAELRAKKKGNNKSTNATSVESVKQTSTNPTVSVNVNDSVNVSDINKKALTNKKSKSDVEIPPLKIFCEYAIEKREDVSIKAVKLKYESWVVNDWKDGNDKPIKNWKTKLLNTISYLPKKEGTTDKEAEAQIRMATKMV